MKIAFTVDDLSPLYSFEHLDLLHDVLDLKFDAFIPSNHFGKALLSNNLDWINELKKRDWIQPNIHGETHTNSMGGNSDYKYLDKIELNRSIYNSICEFNNVGIEVCGIKAPGWDVNNMNDYLNVCKELGLKYACTHYTDMLIPNYTHNNIPTFGYSLCAHESFMKSPYHDFIMHSHIHPSQGDNGFTDELVNHVLQILVPMKHSCGLEPVFLKECL